MKVLDELTVVQNGPVRRITFARAAKRNALSRSLVAALHDALGGIVEGGATRTVVLAGEGPAFCAGGDIAEYAEAAVSGRAEEDAGKLADLLARMAACPVPVVARVHGAAFGGGVGLVCAADVAIAAEGTRFSLSEARLGLVPAVISPYVLAALGERQAKALMLLAAPFDTDEAVRCGVVHRVVPAEELDTAVDGVVAELLRGAPGALATIKRIPSMLGGLDAAATRAATAGLLADRLASEEAREGLRAFLEKRTPAWVPEGS
ncbi:MAG TPA: enoyl-CoA hydratase-related protein [Thermomicrobiales bacterium]